MCFQRDSNKDRIIVWGFLLGTTGLLGWAAFKKVAEIREGKARHMTPQTAGEGYNRVDADDLGDQDR
jgi:hypothetical protein